MGKQRYTAAEVSTALRECKGMVSIAAQRLGCDQDTVLNYCRRYASVEAVKREARNEVLDEAELRLWQAIRRDEPWAISFCLKTLGRARGYGERLDLHIQIAAVAAKVAQELGLSPEAILAEAQQLLQEMDHDALSRPPIG
jgi:hypothetical protein